jgi:hypothetical protein
MRNLVVLSVVLLITAAAAAQPQPSLTESGNRWLLSGWEDSSPDHAVLPTQTICFFRSGVNGTHVVGVWSATTFPNWRGRWAQEGDRVFIYGEFGDRAGHDSMVIDLFGGPTPSDQAWGKWVEWTESTPFDTTVRFANARLQRDGFCMPPPGIADPTKVGAETLEKAVAELAVKVPPRLKADGKPARTPAEPGQVPLQNK